MLFRVMTFQAGYLSVWALTAWSMWNWALSSGGHPSLVAVTYHLLVYPLVKFCAIGGAYIAYIAPRDLHLPHVGISFSGPALLALDAVSHQFPLANLALWHEVAMLASIRVHLLGFLLTTFVLGIYYAMFDWRSRYQLSHPDILYIYGTWNMMCGLRILCKAFC